MIRRPLRLVLLLAGLGAPLVGAAQGTAFDVLRDPDHPEWRTVAPEYFRVRLATGEGEVVIEAFRRWAPLGVDRLYNLVRLGFFDDSRIYRVREGVFAQFGMAGEPDVDVAWYERAMPDDPRARPNLRGVVSYAMLAEPHTRTTQLFINLRDNPDYDAQGFAPIGRVVSGMASVDRFHAGYGEEAGGGMRGGRQGRILAEGNAHLDADFPLLTAIHEARIEPGRVLRYPDVGPNRIRTELHLLPAVSTGPLDPTWSPDGTRIAFSMAGDVWVIDAAGGTATALTAGPAYHFEPAWSPDGRWIALSRDLDGNLDVGIVPFEGGAVRLVTSDPHVDVQPAWSPDGASLYFASARGGDFDLYRAAVAAALASDPAVPHAEPVVGGRGHQIQPAVAPDGSRLAFVSPVEGRLGNGGIWSLGLARELAAEDALATASLVHYEETSFRTKPRWTADGAAIVFVSDESGSNDLAIVPANGGTKARLTEEPDGEMDPSPSPSGRRVAFVSNRGGTTRLYTVDAAGGRRGSWEPVRIEARDARVPTGELVVRVTGEGDEPMPSRVHVTASDGRGYAPEGAFHRIVPATDHPYFHADAQVRLTVPAGRVEVEARRGPEFEAAAAAVEVRPGETTDVVLTPSRLIDMPALGWVSGDTHSHDLHQGRYGLSHEDYFRQLVAEDLRITNALIHMDGTRVMGRWSDLTGEPHPLSTPTHVLQYAQEFRGSFGHVGLLGISEFAMPLIGGTSATAFAADVLNADWLDRAHEQGGIGGYMHPYSSGQDAGASEIPLDVALGKGDFYDVVNYPYDDVVNAEMYWRFLNAGFRLPATGGSDNFADVWRDAPPGSARTYARVDGPVDLPAWLEAVKSGRTFATNGPLVRFTLAPAAPEGTAIGALAAGPGEELGVGPAGPTRFVVAAEIVSAAPLDRVEVVANGDRVLTIDVRGRGSRFLLEETVELSGSGWVALTAIGPAARAVTDAYPFAHTSPVYVVRDGRAYADPDAARFLAEAVRRLWERVRSRDRFPDEAARTRYREAVEEAIRVYERIATTGRAPERPSSGEAAGGGDRDAGGA